MSAQATQPAHTEPGTQAADPHGHREVLHGLIAIGADFARLLHAQATAQPAPVAGQQATLTTAPGTLVILAAAFDQVARVVRRCILLVQRLDKPAPDPARHRTTARKQIIRAVEDRIQCPFQDTCGGNADTLRAELHERMDAPDLDDELRDRPTADIIQDICRDLGLDAHPGTRPFQRRTPADIAQLNARAAAPCGTRQPGGASHDPGRTPTQRSPNLQTGNPRYQPGPARGTPPDDDAASVTLVLGRRTHPNGRWRPPPGG